MLIQAMGCHCHTHYLNLNITPHLLYRRIHNTRSKQRRFSLSSSSLNDQQTVGITKADDAYMNVKLKTLGDCKLGVSIYPDFEYNADGGAGSGTATRDGCKLVFVNFDVEKLYIPPLSTLTTKLLGLPLPPFLKIDIVPDSLHGNIDQQSGKVDLKLRAKFWFSVGRLYKAPPLEVETVLTSEESKGKMRGGKGERLDEQGRCRLVGVATVEPVDDFFMDAFLGLPTECLASLNANLSLN
ncbi:hypothetical protein ACS0TY_002073 [Phlomoides rotata]